MSIAEKKQAGGELLAGSFVLFQRLGEHRCGFFPTPEVMARLPEDQNRIPLQIAGQAKRRFASISWRRGVPNF